MHRVHQVLTPERQRFDRLERFNGGGSRLAVEQRELAEALTRPDDREERLSTGFGSRYYLGSPGLQHVERVAAVALMADYPAEGYYCANASNALQSVGSLANRPTDCSAAGNANASPGDYIQIRVSYGYAPLFPGITVMSAAGVSSITMTSWMRLG